jgi:hypothetical protein
VTLDDGAPGGGAPPGSGSGSGGSVSAATLRLNNNWSLANGNYNGPQEDRAAIPWIGQWWADPDILRLMSVDAPGDMQHGGGCCICRAHAPQPDPGKEWGAEVRAVKGVRVFDYDGVVNAGKTYGPLSAGASQIYLYFEGFTAGGWDKNHFFTLVAGPADNKRTNTVHFVTARVSLWGKTSGSGSITDDANRLPWSPTNTVEVCVAATASTVATPIGMGIWAGSHAKGRAYVELVGTGHFAVTGPFGVVSNGQTRAWAATQDGMAELSVQCFSAGEATLRVCYTNANAVGHGISLRACTRPNISRCGGNLSCYSRCGIHPLPA